ncbi:MAG: LuxR C-terminal-related transcriptional regulator [Gammaproteobacteria bacterium]|nr:LuxR C-terminal-related transcriptional regulator [Gammaproteobacteria bacterium]
MSKPRQNPVFEKNERVIDTLGLTAREVQVLELLAEGDSNTELAKRLFVSTSTIKTHLLHLYQKLDVSRRTQAVQKAKSLEIIR